MDGTETPEILVPLYYLKRESPATLNLCRSLDVNGQQWNGTKELCLCHPGRRQALPWTRLLGWSGRISRWHTSSAVIIGHRCKLVGNDAEACAPLAVDFLICFVLLCPIAFLSRVCR